MKKEDHDLDPVDILGNAYEKMYEDIVSGLHKAEEKSAPILHKLIEEAKEKMTQLGEVSKEDAEKLGNYLERDLSHLVNYLAETSRDLKKWLGFETTLIEAEFLKWMQDVADPTVLEWLRLKEKVENAPYHTGEITGPGTLVCDSCGEELHFYKVGKIPPCPKCHGTTFHRKTT